MHVHVIPRRKGDGLKGFFWPRVSYRDAAHLEDVRSRIERGGGPGRSRADETIAAMTTRRPFGVTLRNKFIAGLVILIPIMLTAKALWWLFTYVDGLAQPIARRWWGGRSPASASSSPSRSCSWPASCSPRGRCSGSCTGSRTMIDDVPLVGSVYGTTKKVLAGFGKEDSQSAFQRFVFAQLPGRTMPGFVTGTFQLTRADGTTDTAVRGVHPDQPPVRRATW